jgi:S1-C subfamily serine protease
MKVAFKKAYMQKLSFRNVGLCLSCLVGLLITAVAQNNPQTLSTAEIVRRANDSVVLIVVNNALGKPAKEGSGFILSSDGKIATNHHVVEGAGSVIVRLSNGASFQMESVLADDPEHDVAIIKVSGHNLPFLELAPVSAAIPGEKVVAIGSPLGLQNSISDGIISGIRTDGKGRKWIQTTAPVSPGNSGGPLLVSDGRVIGAITWGFVEGQNLNFAVPSEVVATILYSSASAIHSVPSNSNSTAKAVRRLSDIKKIAIGSFGATEAANVVREKFLIRLAQSGQLTVVEDAGEADAVISGLVAVYTHGAPAGLPSTAAFRLTDHAGHILWTHEASARGLGSYSSKIADRMASDLLDAISKDAKSADIGGASK